ARVTLARTELRRVDKDADHDAFPGRAHLACLLDQCQVTRMKRAHGRDKSATVGGMPLEIALVTEDGHGWGRHFGVHFLAKRPTTRLRPDSPPMRGGMDSVQNLPRISPESN